MCKDSRRLQNQWEDKEPGIRLDMNQGIFMPRGEKPRSFSPNRLVWDCCHMRDTVAACCCYERI